MQSKVAQHRTYACAANQMMSWSIVLATQKQRSCIVRAMAICSPRPTPKQSAGLCAGTAKKWVVLQRCSTAAALLFSAKQGSVPKSHGARPAEVKMRNTCTYMYATPVQGSPALAVILLHGRQWACALYTPRLPHIKIPAASTPHTQGVVHNADAAQHGHDTAKCCWTSADTMWCQSTPRSCCGR